MPSEVRQEWSTRTGTWAEWVTAFQTVDNVDNAAATAENIKEETFLLKKVEMFRTPLKKRKEKDKEWEDNTLGELVFAAYANLASQQYSTFGRANCQLDNGEGLVTHAVARLETSVMTYGGVLSEVA